MSDRDPKNDSSKIPVLSIFNKTQSSYGSEPSSATASVNIENETESFSSNNSYPSRSDSQAAGQNITNSPLSTRRSMAQADLHVEIPPPAPQSLPHLGAPLSGPTTQVPKVLVSGHTLLQKSLTYPQLNKADLYQQQSQVVGRVEMRQKDGDHLTPMDGRKRRSSGFSENTPSPMTPMAQNNWPYLSPALSSGMWSDEAQSPSRQISRESTKSAQEELESYRDKILYESALNTSLLEDTEDIEEDEEILNIEGISGRPMSGEIQTNEVTTEFDTAALAEQFNLYKPANTLEGVVVEFKTTEGNSVCKMRITDRTKDWKDLVEASLASISDAGYKSYTVADMDGNIPDLSSMPLEENKNNICLVVKPLDKNSNVENLPWYVLKGEVKHNRNEYDANWSVYPYLNQV